MYWVTWNCCALWQGRELCHDIEYGLWSTLWVGTLLFCLINMWKCYGIRPQGHYILFQQVYWVGDIIGHCCLPQSFYTIFYVQTWIIHEYQPIFHTIQYCVIYIGVPGNQQLHSAILCFFSSSQQHMWSFSLMWCPVFSVLGALWCMGFSHVTIRKSHKTLLWPLKFLKLY